jgi:hypothetical protein
MYENEPITLVSIEPMHAFIDDQNITVFVQVNAAFQIPNLSTIVCKFKDVEVPGQYVGGPNPRVKCTVASYLYLRIRGLDVDFVPIEISLDSGR